MTGRRSSVSLLAAGLLCLSVLFISSSTVKASLPTGVNSTALPKSIIVKVLIDGTKNVSADNSSHIEFGKNTLTISWKLNTTFTGKDTLYKQVLLKFCYGAFSAVNRKWRKNNADLLLSRTCQFAIKRFPYTPAGASYVWSPPDDLPTAYYFVRAFVLNSTSPTAVPGHSAIAIGSSTNANRTSSLIFYKAYDGRSTGIVIGIICFSIMSYILLFGFFFFERVMKKNA